MQCQRVIIYIFYFKVLKKIFNKLEYYCPIGFYLVNKIIQNLDKIYSILLL